MSSKLLVSACVFLAGGVSAATAFTEVDLSLQKALASSHLQSAQMKDGNLRVVLNKAPVSELAYATFVYHDICAHQWRQPALFAQWKITRVEVLELGGQQGYAFDARGSACADMGELGKNFRSFILQRSKTCSAGVCPAF